MPKLKKSQKDVANKQYTFQTKFDEAVENCYLMEGFIHLNDADPNECVTLNFRGNGLYTFNTKATTAVQDDDESLLAKKVYVFPCQGIVTEKVSKKNLAKKDINEEEFKED